MGKPQPTACAEMERLRGCVAWSPVARVTRRTKNQHVSFMWFEDGSRLGVYFNGDASWWTAEAGNQRWRGWHRCNK